jgi:hypothetical protein
MPFTKTDLYSSDSGSEIYNYWNPFVTKFDSQSFYNFEQDNQPLYDLEERTHFLWEKTGYAGSALTGMPLVVSSVIPDGVVSFPTNRNVFTSLQDAIDALPDVIRTPTLIEVAVSGQLGALNLKNIEIKDDGVLEIVNRGFAKLYSGLGEPITQSIRGNGDGGWSTGTAIVDTWGIPDTMSCSSTSRGHTVYSTLNTLGSILQVSSLDLSCTILESSAVSVGQSTSGLFNQTGYDKHHRFYVQNTNLSPFDGRRNDKLSVGFGDWSSQSLSLQSFGGAASQNVASFEKQGYGLNNNIEDKSIPVHDVSCLRGDTDLFINRNGAQNSYSNSNLVPVAGSLYVNSLSALTIENCNGPLYVRGFHVDGVSGADLDWGSTPYRNYGAGITVNNSNVTLENCASMRATTGGAEFFNSDVSITRGFFAYRNYKVDGTTRDTTKTAGIKAVNSTISFDTDLVYASGVDFPVNIQAHDYGILLENSVVKGGQSRPSASEYETTVAFAYNDIGIKATNSIIDLSGNLDVYNNNTGMVLEGCKLSTDRISVDHNINEGIVATNSNIIYGNTFTKRAYSNDASSTRTTQSLFTLNGQHLVLNDSTFSYDTEASAYTLPTKFGGLRFHDSHGVSNRNVSHHDIKKALPSVNLNNSHANLIHSRINVSGGAMGSDSLRFKGAGLHATNNSTANFMGTVNGATMIIGPSNLNSSGAAAAYADKGSKLSFRGPTVLAQFGYGAIADNNSTVEFVPHKKDDFSLDPSGFALDASSNHTSVEIHTNYHTCVGANNNSQIIMEDLGCPIEMFGTTNADYSPISRFVSAGSMQFYPNSANTAFIGDGTCDKAVAGHITDNNDDADKMSAGSIMGGNPLLHYNYMITDPWKDGNAASATIMNTISNGGLCVQVAGDSVVDVNSVHFLMGHPKADGSFFDPSATAGGCNQLRIWNIADNSKLYASHLATSGTNPGELFDDAGIALYHGPRSTFFSGTNTEGGTGSVYDDSGGAQGSRGPTAGGAFVAYGARPDTPDTSALSVLDTFGLGVGIHPDQYKNQGIGGPISLELSSLNPIRAGAATGAASGDSIFGCLTPSNIGPFRLYFSPKTETRFLSYVSGSAASLDAGDARLALFANDTRPLQHIAQGYSLSSWAGVHPNKEDVSSTTTALFGDPWGSTDLSGYYYPSALLPSDRGTQVFLDESAANVFANAKHCAAKPQSARANPKVSIYRSKTTTGGEGYAGTGSTDGIGSGLRSISIFDIRRQV